MKKAKIGITLDWREKGEYSPYPWVALGSRYPLAVQEEGGIPLPLFPEKKLIESYIDICDGFIVSGSNFDIDPQLYGVSEIHPTVTINSKRTDFEYALIQHILERDKPLLAICGGHQLLNVVLGGTLIQHIPDGVENACAHQSIRFDPKGAPRHLPSHEVSVVEDTQLSRIVGAPSLAVNSAHHQAIETIGRQVRANAYAPDGVIEGIEVLGSKFCLGIQWHPEYMVSPGDRKIFQSFIQSSL